VDITLLCVRIGLVKDEAQGDGSKHGCPAFQKLEEVIIAGPVNGGTIAPMIVI
jgi:hypothetical protein